MPFAAAPSGGNGLNGGNGNGGFTISSWNDYIRSVYGASVKPTFVGDLNTLYSFKLPGQGAGPSGSNPGNQANGGNAGSTPSGSQSGPNGSNPAEPSGSDGSGASSATGPAGADTLIVGPGGLISVPIDIAGTTSLGLNAVGNG